ncbi:MAG: ABC transporter ATP-binding protein [Alphaproteobacteria bacterium]|nr:ABC transporter ATP-binding protein [Alphaproteobacteria bacterium]
MTEEYLKVKNLYKNYGDIKAVNNVTFSAKKGEIIALLGPNGAGKSTLMNMISGYLSPSSGDIFVCDKNIKDNPLWGKENIGFLPEGSPLYADLTVKDFLKYMAELRDVSYKNVENAIKTAKIENVALQKVETLSKGYQRRVGFAQSILSNPPLLLLDEPTDGLDPNQKKHIRSLISQMGKDKTILISTHLLEEAENVCNRIIMINKGTVVADGTLKNILEKHNKKNLEEIFYDLAGEEGEKA